MQKNKECYICRELYDINMQVGLECHHIFGGANRNISEKQGLKVWLCQAHHNTAPHGVHFNYDNMKWLRERGQLKFEEKHSREEFRRLFSRSYL